MLLPLAFNFDQYVFGPLLFLLSLFIILIVLLQRGRGGGLAGALGGAGGSSALGVKAGDIFTRITAVSVILWIFLCAFVCWFYLEPLPDISASPASATPSLSIGPRDGAAGSGMSSDEVSSDEASSDVVSPAQTVLPTPSQAPASDDSAAKATEAGSISDETKPVETEEAEVKKDDVSTEATTESSEAANTEESKTTDDPPVSAGDGDGATSGSGDGGN